MSFGVSVRKGLVVPERDLRQFSWVLAKQKEQVWTQTLEVVDCILGFLALPKVVALACILPVSYRPQASRRGLTRFAGLGTEAHGMLWRLSLVVLRSTCAVA